MGKINLQVMTKFLNIVSIIIIFFPLKTIISHKIVSQSDPLSHWTRPKETIGFPIDNEFENKPDIYYIIVDGYARDDVLLERYHYDNISFRQFLSERGFYIAKNSHSNYLNTLPSLSSSLNLNYLDFFPKAGKDSVNYQPFMELISHSNIQQIFTELGYQFVTINSGYKMAEIRDGNPDLSYKYGGMLSDFETVLLSKSLAQIPSEFGLIPSFGYDAHRNRILDQFQQLSNISSLTIGNNAPKFIFAHIISPHPPFLFGRNGEKNEWKMPFIFLDGNLTNLNPNEYIKQYINQLYYTNTLLITTISAILENSPRPPIIILQADHGPGTFLDFNSFEKTCIKDRASILNAYYFPGQKTDLLYPTISPVNTFRVILNTYFKAEIPILEDKTYYSYLRPFNFIEVTERIEIACQDESNAH